MKTIAFDYEIRFYRNRELTPEEGVDKEKLPITIKEDETLHTSVRTTYKPSKEELCRAIDYMCEQLKEIIMLENTEDEK